MLSLSSPLYVLLGNWFLFKRPLPTCRLFPLLVQTLIRKVDTDTHKGQQVLHFPMQFQLCSFIVYFTSIEPLHCTFQFYRTLPSIAHTPPSLFAHPFPVYM